MEYAVFFLVIGLLVLVLAGKGIYDAKKEKRQFADGLRRHYGEPPEKEYQPGRFEAVPCFYKRHKRDGQLDDITWNDLGMDEVFKRLDYTLSAAGEEVLYDTLRSPLTEEETLLHRERLIAFYSANEKERVAHQLLFKRLGHTGRFSLYDYLDYLDALGKRSNVVHIAADLCYIPAVCLILFNPPAGVLLLVLLMLFCIITYFKEKGENEPYITSFSYVLRLLDVARRMERILPAEAEEERRVLAGHTENLARFRKGSFWVMSPARTVGSGSPLDMVMDYCRMIFHADLIKFNSMLEQMRAHTEDVDRLFAVLGSIEVTIAVGAYRASLKEGYCIPVFAGQGVFLAAEALYHPMLEKPVKNAIRADRGVLLTGSNASGKSTFLKAVALNAVFAQTIHTAAAASYTANFFRVYTSMALKDDLAGGESYYVVEIRAIKRILDEAASGQSVLCVVDEVLRGTNTVERIAASAEILKSFSGKKVLCFAATHDVELTGLLESCYDNYHFEEEIADGDVRFPYRLQPGRATTRNAIRLLLVMGYADSIVENAEKRAENFVKDGVWK